MRGEESHAAKTASFTQELPPHARRRGALNRLCQVVFGITSACAEKSCCSQILSHGLRNYLRMRGEEVGAVEGAEHAWELPPHARRRAIEPPCDRRCHGITSACAEKRMRCISGSFPWWNYLRMRGEEERHACSITPLLELPPHARRRGRLVRVHSFCLGITSACAEKSASTY